MGASRESYSLWTDWKYNRSRFWKNLKILLFSDFLNINKIDRKLIWIDSFRTPFNKKWGCKLFGHNWKYDQEDNYYICWKCFKHESKNEHIESQRDEKINEILK